MSDWSALLEALREECPSALWSRGVELARAGVVAGEEREGAEWRFRVRVTGRPIPPAVSLYPEDSEWECDCGGRFEACEHVAACAVAATQAQGGPESLFTGPDANGSIRHELIAAPGGLIVERRILQPGRSGSEGRSANAAGHDGDAGNAGRSDGNGVRLEGSLLDRVARRSDELGVAPSHADLDVDRFLSGFGGRRADRPVPFDRVAGLLRLLVGVSDIRFDGRAVRASSEPLYPRASIRDARGDRGAVELTIEADPEVDAIVAPGVLLRGDVLHPFGAGRRFGERWEKLPLRRTFEPAQFAELIGEVLPDLRRTIPLEIHTQRLPQEKAALCPVIRFEIDMDGGSVDILPLLVYADPADKDAAPTARVDAGRLVHLGGPVPVRDEPAEKRLQLALKDRTNLMPGRRVRLEGADAARVLAEIEEFERSGRHGGGPKTERARAALVARLITSDSGDEAGTAVDVAFEVAGSGDRQVSAGAVITAWREGIGLVSLGAGEFARVPEAWLERHGDLVAELLSARQANDGALPRAALPLIAELCEALEQPPPFEVERLRGLLSGMHREESAAQGAGRVEDTTQPCPQFRGELRPYQQTGVRWLQRLREAGLGAVLADDMGLGKTIQALCVLEGRSLIVCPRSVIHNWVRELEKFRPDLSVQLYHGPRRSLGDADVTLTTYATMRNDIDALSTQGWGTVVLDEAQAIKNPDSQAARAAFRLEAEFCLSLSGTPIENRPSELWSQMHFANRGLLGGRSDFTARYEAPLLADDPTTLERLRRRIRPFVLRRLKRDVASDLPPRTDSVLHVELDDTERAAYDAVRNATRADVVRNLTGSGGVLAALEALLRLRQAACHRGLLPGMDAVSSSKVEALCEALEDAAADGHKALVFSQWTGLLDRVQPHLERLCLDFVRLDGSTRDRAGVVDRFQSADGPPVMLVSLTAGGTGLNLTAADHVFLLDPWWNPAVEDQAADRAHRIGQDRPVMVYRLVAKDTVEERVLDLQARKRAVAQGVLDGGSGAAALTREDILALLD